MRPHKFSPVHGNTHGCFPLVSRPVAVHPHPTGTKPHMRRPCFLLFRLQPCAPALQARPGSLLTHNECGRSRTRKAGVGIYKPDQRTRMKRQYLLPTLSAALLCLLSACAQQTPATPAAPPANSATGQCNPSGAQFAVGRAAEAALVEQARQRSGAQMARVIRPGQPVTLDYNLQRLNLDIDAGNRITRAHCG